jgi:galactokinase
MRPVWGGERTVTEVVASLRAAGMGESDAAGKEALNDLCAAALARLHVSAERQAFFVPGRIEVLGKHTDYAGGRSILCAVPRGFVVVAAPRPDNVVEVVDAQCGEAHSFELTGGLAGGLDYAAQDWGSYVAACLRRITRNFPGAARGAHITFASDLPQASGLSSSSALSTAIFLAMDAVNQIHDRDEYRAAIQTREDLAGYLGTIENGQSFGWLEGAAGVGTFGGSEDHTAILCCRSGFLSQYSFAPVRAEGEVALPAGKTFVVAFSGVAAEKGGAAQGVYNQLSLQVRRILYQWNAASGRSDLSLAAAVASAPDAPAQIRAAIRVLAERDGVRNRLVERFEQFVSESTEVIPAASAALARGDVIGFGREVERSQRGAALWLRNQIPETIGLVRSARELGADAASAFGGGWGGSVWALVDADDALGFTERWRAGYARTFSAASARAVFFESPPGPCAQRVLFSREK